MSDLEDIMDNKTNISDYDLFLDQGNETANNVGYNVTSMNVTQEHCIPSSEEGYLSPYASFPILIVSLVLGQLLRNVDSNLECNKTSFSLIAFLFKKVFVAASKPTAKRNKTGFILYACN